MPHPLLLLLFLARATERNLVRQLMDGDAVDPASAVPLARILSPLEASRLAALIRNGFVAQTPDGRCYLRQARWLASLERSQRAANAVLAVIMIVGVLWLVLR